MSVLRQHGIVLAEKRPHESRRGAVLCMRQSKCHERNKSPWIQSVEANVEANKNRFTETALIRHENPLHPELCESSLTLAPVHLCFSALPIDRRSNKQPTLVDFPISHSITPNPRAHPQEYMLNVIDAFGFGASHSFALVRAASSCLVVVLCCFARLA